MKSLFSVLFFLVFFSEAVFSQPVITKNDMPSAGDTIRYRSTMFAPGLNYQQTGLNFTWDYSTLTGTTVGADTFVTMGTTPLFYQLAFLLGSNNANLASPQPDISFIPGFPMTNIYNFYKKANASYNMAGMGATIAGLPIPIKYSAPDVIYKFPITIGSEDSSQVSFAQGVTGLGYLSIEKNRHNYVDGWGTLILPTGSFPVVRVKSVITETDSIHVDTLGVGFSIPRNSIEYKWLATGKGLPVLEVTNSTFTTTWKWLDDSAVSGNFQVALSNDTVICAGESITLQANATGGTAPYTYLWSTFQTGQTITVTPTATTTYSVTVIDAGFATAIASVTVSVTSALQVNLVASDTTLYASPCNGWPTTSVLTINSGFVNYFWSTGQSGANLNSITVQSPYLGYQKYFVTVTSASGCEGIDSVRILYDICCNAIHEISSISNISISPNPGRGVVKVEFSALKSVDLKLEIISMTGIKLKEYNQLIHSGMNFIEINVPDLNISSGTYLLRLTTKDFNFTRKLLLK